MSTISPNAALDTLYRSGRISYEEMVSLKATQPVVIEGAMRAIESSGHFLNTLSSLVGEIKDRAAEQERMTKALLGNPLYAEAPGVSGILVKQFWEAGDYLVEIAREDFTVPLPYLVANRERLRTVTDEDDCDWLAYDLGLLAGHEGPFDVTDIEESLDAWLAATQGAE